jgi:hypothetical protein
MDWEKPELLVEPAPSFNSEDRHDAFFLRQVVANSREFVSETSEYGFSVPGNDVRAPVIIAGLLWKL